MNLAEEKRKGYVIGTETKKIWAVELEIARYILDVCKRHNLKIWADWGTLLGAVREKGFIPWDNDIDFMMMRSDYEKLRQIAPAEFTSPFFFQSAYTDKNYFHGHGQVRYDGTAAIFPYDIDQSFHQGIFVDIFVYDNLPDNKNRQWKRSLRRALWAQKCLQTAFYKKFRFKDPLTSVKFILARIACFCLGPMTIYRFYERQITAFNLQESLCVACPSFDLRQIDRETRKRIWYEQTVMLPFEDMEMPVPAGYENVLRALYGDNYMTPVNTPPEHGNEIFFDTSRSYTEVLAELRKDSVRNKKHQL